MEINWNKNWNFIWANIYGDFLLGWVERKMEKIIKHWNYQIILYFQQNCRFFAKNIKLAAQGPSCSNKEIFVSRFLIILEILPFLLKIWKIKIKLENFFVRDYAVFVGGFWLKTLQGFAKFSSIFSLKIIFHWKRFRIIFQWRRFLGCYKIWHPKLFFRITRFISF